MNMIPLYRGEFGLEVRFRVPVVYAMGEVAVELESGKEALYPRAKHKIVKRKPESTPQASKERGAQGRPRVSGPEERFVPEPHVPQDTSEPDVFVCPRWRDYVPQKNWPHWPDFVEMLKAEGLKVFAGGVADASDTRVDCEAAWDYSRPLDASVEAVKAAKLVVAPCSGLCHLAVLCGAPLLIFTYGGRDAPGPVITSSGRKVADQRPMVKMDEYYRSVNHTGAPIMDMDGWEHPERVAERVVEYVR